MARLQCDYALLNNEHTVNNRATLPHSHLKSNLSLVLKKTTNTAVAAVAQGMSIGFVHPVKSNHDLLSSVNKPGTAGFSCFLKCIQAIIN